MNEEQSTAQKHGGANPGSFSLGLILGAAIALGLGTEEGKTLTKRLIESLKDLVENRPDLFSKNDDQISTGRGFPPPPSNPPPVETF